MFNLSDLPYDYGALEPYIDAQTMELHHKRHHQAYIDKLNAAIQDTEWESKTIEEILKNLDKLPDKIKATVQNNGGGHYNHALFWESMSPEASEPSKDLHSSITEAFGSFSEFQTKLSETAISRFGSGWAWLVKNGNSLQVMSTPNQDSPISDDKIPLLGLDVWEHAYYLKYQNRRPEYIEAWWNVVNWTEVSRRFEQQ